MILALTQFFALFCTSRHFCFIFILFCNCKTGTQIENLFILYDFYSSKLADTVVEKTNRPKPIFHTKLAFLRAILETKSSKNCLVLLRANQNVQEEHNL